jgi:MFS family permease
VANGVIFSMAEAFYAPSVVLPWFVSRLGGPHILIGLLPAITSGGWFLPQLIIASRVHHLPRKMPWYIGAGVIRVLAMLLLGLLTLLLAAQPGWLLLSFFALYTIYCLCGGVGGIPWLEVVGKTIPPRRRGAFFGQRAFWGGVLALGVSFFVSFLLDEGQRPGSPVAFPLNFALLFGVATIFVAIAIGCWALVREPADRRTGPRLTIRDEIRRGPQIVREDRNYRSFLFARVLLAFSAIGDPFYVVYARERLHAPAATVGLYLAALTISGIASNLVWTPLSDRASPRRMMGGSTLAVLAPPLAALALPPLLAVLSRLGAGVPGASEWGYLGFGLVFVLIGFASGAGRVINNNLLLDIAPAAERPTYIGFLNTVLGLATLVPIAGGSLVDRVGFEPLFALAAGLAGLAFAVSFGLSAVRRGD